LELSIGNNYQILQWMVCREFHAVLLAQQETDIVGIAAPNPDHVKPANKAHGSHQSGPAIHQAESREPL